MRRKILIFWCLLWVGIISPSAAQAPVKPMILPMANPAGLDAWFMGQPYGNTTASYNFGAQWYSAGQRLHFGMDFFMPCGTPLLAVADGEVHAVDAMSFGSAPHNLILKHPALGLTTLYGHLLQTPTLIAGQPVKQGDVVAISGDPDGECNSRPHLHLEVRSADFRTTYNPVDYIEAPWHTLALLGPFNYPIFQQDMDNPRRWMSLFDQPEVNFGGPPLNNYNRTWPYTIDVRPPANAPLPRSLDPLPLNSQWQARQVAFENGCCPNPWWHPVDSNRFYVMDGVVGERANVFEWTLDGTFAPTPLYPAPPMLTSPDGNYQITRVNGQITVRDLVNSGEWRVDTQGALPSLSTDNSRLLWEVWRGTYLPGEPYQTVETWVSNADGSNTRMIWLQAGGYAVWLDEARVLIVTPVLDRTDTTLTIFDTRDDSYFVLGVWDWLRNMDIAPGGGRIMFWVNWQTDPAQNGLYTIETREGATAQKIPWFGAWRWRDANSVYYIPFDSTDTAQHHILAYYDVLTGEDRYLTSPTETIFTVANGEWWVSPDGNRILFRNGRDLSIWVLETGKP